MAIHVRVFGMGNSATSKLQRRSSADRKSIGWRICCARILCGALNSSTENNLKMHWCPGWESNPHEEKSPEDFKSSASAIPPPGRWHYKSNERRDLLQHRRLHRGLPKHASASSGVSGAFRGCIQTLDGGCLASSPRSVWRANPRSSTLGLTGALFAQQGTSPMPV
jgi:hypothetical protein